jgi:peptidoglycan/LPS O-acetylase OafA/YrhL
MHRYYYGLDAVRFFSACAVCLFHLGFYAWAAEYSAMHRIFAGAATFDLLTPVAWMGWIGVQIFFVISGFVIANSANGATPFAFLRSRLLRLWPAAWICATITLGVRLLAGETFGDLDSSWLRSLLLWPKGEWIDRVYWSLAIEIAFYGLVFLLLLTRNFRRLPAMAWVLTLVSAAFIVLAGLDASGMATQGSWFDATTELAEILPLRHGVFFAIGIWLWMMSNKPLSGLHRIGLALGIVAGLCEIELRAWEMQTLEAPASAGQLLAAPAILWLVAVAFIARCTQRPENFVPRTETARTRLKLIGKITYPLYLVHSIVGAAAMAWFISMGVTSWLALANSIALVIGIAALVALYGEALAARPLRGLVDAAGKSASGVKALALLFRKADAIPDKQA